MEDNFYENIIRQTAADIVTAKESGGSRMLTFGTDLIRNGLSPLVGEFVRRGWITHLATTGTSVADDFGAGPYYLNLAVLVGAWQGLGFGESVAKVIAEGKIVIPEKDVLRADIGAAKDLDRVAGAAELLRKIEEFGLKAGEVKVEIPDKGSSLIYTAYEAGIPFTIHPMFGLDDFFTHPMCSFAAVGHASEADFLYFTNSVFNLENGIYMSVGSSVASPMIFEKALSMSQNILIRQGTPMTNHKIVVVDLAPSRWDWMHDGEPPETRPEYYLRYCKSFSRAKAKSMYYVCADNRDFFSQLFEELNKID